MRAAAVRRVGVVYARARNLESIGGKHTVNSRANQPLQAATTTSTFQQNRRTPAVSQRRRLQFEWLSQTNTDFEHHCSGRMRPRGSESSPGR